MLASWLSALGNYSFDIIHRRGQFHCNADGLSRQRPRKCKRDDCEDCSLETKDCVCVVSEQQITMLGEDMLATSPSDPNVAMCENSEGSQADCRIGDSENCVENALNCICVVTRSQAKKNLVASPTRSNVVESKPCSLGGSEDCVHIPGMVFVPNSGDPENTECSAGTENASKERRSSKTNAEKNYKHPLRPNWVETWSIEEICDMQTADPAINSVIKLKLENPQKPDKIITEKADCEKKALYAQWDYLEIHDNVLYRGWEPRNPDDREYIQIVVPPELRKEILYMLHSHKTSSHLGVAKTLGKLRQRFYWPGHKADVERWCTK